MNHQLLTSSTLNDHFIGEQPSFDDYTNKMQQIITQGRLDLNASNKQMIMTANSPFNWRPSTKATTGILFIHGLYDSPYSLMDIAKKCVEQGYLARGILLPGHGTRPGDLLHTQYQDWLNAARFGIESLFKEVEQVFVVGFSLGGAIASMMLHEYPSIRGGILFAPLFHTQWRWAFVSDWQKFYSWAGNFVRWYKRHDTQCHVKYTSFPINAAYQVRKLMHKNYSTMTTDPFKQPVMIVATDTDESVSTNTILNWFANANQANNHLLLYSRSFTSDDPRITVRTSFYPKQNIVDFSHICLPTSPDNPYLGMNGEFKDYLHYPDLPPYEYPKIIGSTSNKNLLANRLQRLTYNPDFDFMSRDMLDFLQQVTL